MHGQEERHKVLDRDDLMERVDGDAEFLRELAGIFYEDCPKLLARMETAIRAGDARELERAAHALKGSVANFGATTAREAAFTLERMGRSGQLDSAEQLYGALEDEIVAFRVALDALAAELLNQT
jgi:two-component system, sensor histidine kinase and response regulator